MNFYSIPQGETTTEADPIPQRVTYKQDDGTGFIRPNVLRLKVAAKVKRKASEPGQQSYDANREVQI